MAPTLRLVLALALAASAQAFDHAIRISSPDKVPSGASWNVPHDFASYSIPGHWFADFAGNLSHPNLFSRDIFDLLYEKTGAHPFIRVGGTSTDRIWYNASQEAALINVYDSEGGTAATQNIGIPDHVNIGPAFFEGFLNFPGSRWTWQINMGQNFNIEGGLDNSMKVAEMVVDYLQDRLESFEIGNEPDLMPLFHHRPKNFTLADYVRQWNHYANAASERVLKNNKFGLEETRFFQALTFAELSDDWNLQDAFALGLDSGNHVKSLSYHNYAAMNQGWVRLQNSFMNHTANKDNITQFDDVIGEAHSHDPPLPLVLGETNNDAYNLNMAQVEGVFGSALWLIDHLLLGMVANMTRENIIVGTTFGYTEWVPVPRDGRDPYVRPPLYGHVFVAEVLGRHPEVQISPISDLPWNMSAYGVYESGNLARYVVVNYDEWNSTTPYPRPQQDVHIDVPAWADNVQVRRLTGAGAESDEGIQWAGQSWNYTDGRLAMTGREEWEVVKTKNGAVDLSIRSTEAVLISLAGHCI